MDFTPGKAYNLKIVFARPGTNNVTIDPGNGDAWMQQTIEGDLVAPLHTLKDKTATFICREVTEKGPSFDLAPEYFKQKDKTAPAATAATAAVVPLAKLYGIEEGEKVEFKSSIIYSPVTHQADSSQPFAIAKEIAAFMNTDGGTLYLGVANDGTVCGIEGDFAALGAAPIKMPDRTDADFNYKPNRDCYGQKLRNLIRFYLGDFASSMIKDPEWIQAGGRTYAKLEIPPTGEEAVYLGKNEHLVYRTGSESVHLIGRARDQYTRVRFHHGAVADIRKMLEEFTKSMGSQILPGRTITVLGGQPFTKEAIDATKRPKSLAWDGAHYAEVSGWQELVLKVLEKLQEVNAAKFDELAGQKEFSKVLIKVIKPKEKHGDCYPTKFGADGKVRIKKHLGNKVNLWQEDKVLRKLIAAFGVDVGKFMFVAG